MATENMEIRIRGHGHRHDTRRIWTSKFAHRHSDNGKNIRPCLRVKIRVVWDGMFLHRQTEWIYAEQIMYNYYKQIVLYLSRRV